MRLTDNLQSASKIASSNGSTKALEKPFMTKKSSEWRQEIWSLVMHCRTAG